MLEGKIPHDRWKFFNENCLLEENYDCTKVLHQLRETKSDWEIKMFRESGEITKKCLRPSKKKED